MALVDGVLDGGIGRQCAPAGDGIEQDETISPLIWRIFYDPLLRRIQGDPGLGYKVKQSELLDIQTNKVRVNIVRQAAVAFADDTTWVAESKEQMNSILRIAQRFFAFNDIQINERKPSSS